jgi:hypothetical protein
MKTVLKSLKIFVGCFIVFYIAGVLFSPASFSGKPSMGRLVRDGCIRYLAFAEYAATNRQFAFDVSAFSTFAKTNHFFDHVGIATYSSEGLTNETILSGAIRYAELAGSTRAIFNTNQDYYAKTNFSFKYSNPEPVIVCKQPVLYSFQRSFLSWSWRERRSVHAVGYSDGTTEMISPERFHNLDLNAFVPLSSLGVEGFHARFDERSFKP